ncbi:hypothetical protein BGY98DRAFT_978743 [Russula aff. rugulosa BPL654]|nr:hypothetical protein BGY98DRAFT_978743 [Russula aff. rugulosa BPL654]
MMPPTPSRLFPSVLQHSHPQIPSITNNLHHSHADVSHSPNCLLVFLIFQLSTIDQ